MSQSKELGTESIGRLLVKMAVPAALGILVLSINFIVDTIFVGRYVGTLAIAAITVVMPISFLISSIGMAIGVGGSSVISRALGADDTRKANRTFANMATLTFTLAILLLLLCVAFKEPVLILYGGKGDILAPAETFFNIVLLSVPALAWAMMSNNVMRAEGRPKMAMYTMMIPSIINIILDPILILGLDMGLEGAGWATTISYFCSAAFALWYFFPGPSELKIRWSQLPLKKKLVREIASIGSVTLARQGAVSLLMIVLNHSLFAYGDELAVAVFGVINRIMMFANFPVLGITQGFLPIAGYNYGADKLVRVKDSIRISILSGTLISMGLFLIILLFAEPIISLFTTDPELLGPTPRALRIVFLAIPLVTAQLVGSAYFQAIGKALPALLLTLTKQGFFLVPLVLTMPRVWGLDGIWYAFPVADVLAATVTLWYLSREVRMRLNPAIELEPKVEVIEE